MSSISTFTKIKKDNEFSIIISNKLPNVTVDYSKSLIRYKLPKSINLKGYDAGLSMISLYNSFDNFTPALGNNTFTVKQDDTSYNFTIDRGMYQVSDLNNYIQFELENQGLWMKDASGNNVPFIQVLTNRVYEKVTLEMNAVPDTLPAGYTKGDNLLLTGKTMQFVLNNTGLATYLGFVPGTYPSAAGNSISFNGTILPQVARVENMFVCMNKIDEGNTSSLSEAIFTLAPNTGTRELMRFNVELTKWKTLSDGNYSEFVFYLVDQNLRPIEYSEGNTIILEIDFRNRDSI